MATSRTRRVFKQIMRSSRIGSDERVLVTQELASCNPHGEKWVLVKYKTPAEIFRQYPHSFFDCYGNLCIAYEKQDNLSYGTMEAGKIGNLGTVQHIKETDILMNLVDADGNCMFIKRKLTE